MKTVIALARLAFTLARNPTRIPFLLGVFRRELGKKLRELNAKEGVDAREASRCDEAPRSCSWPNCRCPRVEGDE